MTIFFFFFSSRRRHTRSLRDWSSDVCSSDLSVARHRVAAIAEIDDRLLELLVAEPLLDRRQGRREVAVGGADHLPALGRRAGEPARGESPLEARATPSVRYFDS